jgi:hypothetical protein
MLGIVLVAAAAGLAVPAVIQRRRMKRLLQSGDVNAVIAAFRATGERVADRETMGPLIDATAFAAHGFVEKARTSLARATRGPAWEAALEHRLVVETLLDAFEGRVNEAMDSAGTLRRLPLPPSPMLRARVRELRQAMNAFARAFAHRAERGDLDALSRAGRANPLVHWALAYAAAVVHIDGGNPDRARKLLDRAPDWPDESVFQAFHTEIHERSRRHSG